jgi:uncharacterized protein YdeI (YjbR/CyaY-like superfamily)
VADAVSDEPEFFDSPEAFRSWLEANHATAAEKLVGFYKKAAGRPTLTWSQSVDEALCFGWIDGRARSLGPDAWCIRFTPRRPGSIWSAVNVRKVAALTEQGRMRPAGLAAFARRAPERTAVYSHEQDEPPALAAEQEARLRADPAAAAFWDAQPPGYRRAAAWWVISAKRPETREQRLGTLIADSAAGRRVKPLAPR